ncbi:mandelate racemase/muconate lactonizing enzyme family protein [Oleispirillum naphthae]|uniref:mandelate racemase/muconate lactonizing enzyme family protein n=1 Tax=Oleispirillum naphthae TaxID=2838853 RepID=UPI0030825B23
MKIVELRGYQVGYTPAEPLGNASGFIRRRGFFLVEAVTASGLSGWGEVFSSPYAAGAFLRHTLAPLVLGESVFDYGRLWHRMTAALGYDRRGAGMMAVSALDMALHDAAARERGLSVAAMLGGALRQRLPAYASGPFLAPGGDPYRDYPRHVEAYLRRGFRGIKPRAGVTPRADGAMTAALRRQAGDDAALMIDFNRGCTLGSALASARRMAEADLLWMEEPLSPEAIPGYREIARAAVMPVAGGEALAGVAAFREVLAAGIFAILQPDLSVCGGYTGFARVAALAAAYDLPVMPHVFGTAVNFHASLQMAALLPGAHSGWAAPYPFIEVDATDNPLLRLCGEAAIAADGTIAIPDAPGTGLDLHRERLLPWTEESWCVTA